MWSRKNEKLMREETCLTLSSIKELIWLTNKVQKNLWIKSQNTNQKGFFSNKSLSSRVSIRDVILLDNIQQEPPSIKRVARKREPTTTLKKDA